MCIICSRHLSIGGYLLNGTVCKAGMKGSRLVLVSFFLSFSLSLEVDLGLGLIWQTGSRLIWDERFLSRLQKHNFLFVFTCRSTTVLLMMKSCCMWYQTVFGPLILETMSMYSWSSFLLSKHLQPDCRKLSHLLLKNFNKNKTPKHVKLWPPGSNQTWSLIGLAKGLGGPSTTFHV